MEKRKIKLSLEGIAIPSLISVVLLPLVLLGAGSVFLRSGGFSIAQVSSPLSYDPRWEVDPLTEEQRAELEKIFSQKFTFLKSGSQVYAFASYDGKYVLKLFKMKSLLPKEWLNHFPFFLLKEYRYRKVDLRKKNLQLAFGGFKTAYENFREQSGLLFVHLNKTACTGQKIVLTDCKGREFILDLDTTPFVLQKKAELIRHRLVKRMESGQEEMAVEEIRLLLRLIAERLGMGLKDLDPGIKCNYGFIGSIPVQIDCGRLLFDPAVKAPQQFEKEIGRVVERLVLWAELKYPKLCQAIQEEGAKVIADD